LSALDGLLEHLRRSAQSKREKGTYFERVAKAYLSADPLQREEFSEVWIWSDWASQHGWDGRDTGIDLVAKLNNEEGFAAIQAKFYEPHTLISKQHIDSFISASGKEPFRRRLVIDTTETDWSDNAEDMIRGQTIPVSRIGLNQLRESRIDWAIFQARDAVVLKEIKSLRPHQVEALEAVADAFRERSRGKLIMACGAGKTFTALRIAEHLTGPGGYVLFKVPSLALMSQAIQEWVSDAVVPLRAFSVCSDVQVGKRRKTTDDAAEIEVHDLALPATTNPARLADKAGTLVADRMTVVFSTYQSIDVLTRAHAAGLPEFDLIICDEAHRTTGATLAGEDESAFVRVHNDKYVRGRKRLYMTATPRIFGDAVRSKADEVGAEIASMDDPELFGETIFHRGFGWAVQNGLLTDYKVIVLAMDEAKVSAAVQRRLADTSRELQLDDATKILGCYKALAKIDLKADVGADTQPMRRALAFCRSIEASKLIQREFAAVVEEASQEGGVIGGPDEDVEDRLRVEIEHVDGTFNAKSRGRLLQWLKDDAGEGVCRVLTNARCLSEGVDVPALDGILFLHPRKSQIDVVQSVGRVMRRAEGKRMGYVILPVGVPAGMAPEEALKDNERYRTVWQILNALRAHDERFDGTINQASLGQDVSHRIEIVNGTPDRELAAVTAMVTSLPGKERPRGAGIGHGAAPGDDEPRGGGQAVLGFPVDEFSRAIMAKIVRKCGTRDYWEDWAGSVAKIAQTHISRLQGILSKPDTPTRAAFDRFLSELRADLNDAISEDEAIEMLAQHIITRPVFETLFAGSQFTAENPVSKAMQRVLDVLDGESLDRESRDLDKFYTSVRSRAHGITDPQAKQRLVVELYDKFFRNAFPKTTERLGIVYTPVEIVDFIIRSVNDVLQDEFGQTLGSEGVHIIDPFTGTGSFITRLLQSGLIAPEDLERKYRREIHANEIVLLAYYIAAINIEAVYHGLQGGDYVPFDGICLTDTFGMHERRDLVERLMPDNNRRMQAQRALDIRVIIGNPPYAVAQGVAYPQLDGRITATYAARSEARNKNALYDSYIRAIRWASDRLGDSGVIGFVTNGGWVDANTADGLRKCLADEFTSIFVFHLRGNARTSGEARRQEAGNAFGAGTRAPIVITILVRNPAAARRRILFHDIGDYWSREDKLRIVRDFASIRGITAANGWSEIAPDSHGDWVKQRDRSFERFIAIGDKDAKEGEALFAIYSAGLKTQRDAWCYNASRTMLQQNVRRSVDHFNRQLAAWKEAQKRDARGGPELFMADAPTEIAWSAGIRNEFTRGRELDESASVEVRSLYRPFSKEWLHFSPRLNERRYRMPLLFPTADHENRLICLSGAGGRAGLSVLMTDVIPSLHAAAMDGSQCFPLRVYKRDEEPEDGSLEHLLDNAPAPTTAATPTWTMRDGIADAGLAHFRTAYPGEAISKEDVFYYVYGLLHAPDYAARYADNLLKELPRIPRVRGIEAFRAFADAGRRLGDLHVGYETVEPWSVTYRQGDPRTWVVKDPERFYRVTKWAFGKDGKARNRSTVIYNADITMIDVPLEAYDYVVNGKPALEWVMERQSVRTDKDSGIVNDPNRYAIETMGDPAYPLKLFQRVITVSIETMRIVRALPPLGEPT